MASIVSNASLPNAIANAPITAIAGIVVALINAILCAKVIDANDSASIPVVASAIAVVKPYWVNVASFAPKDDAINDLVTPFDAIVSYS